MKYLKYVPGIIFLISMAGCGDSAPTDCHNSPLANKSATFTGVALNFDAQCNWNSTGSDGCHETGTYEDNAHYSLTLNIGTKSSSCRNTTNSILCSYSLNGASIYFNCDKIN